MSKEHTYISFDEVKQKVTISQVMTALGIANRFQWKGDSASGVCPLPGHSHGNSPNPRQFKVNRIGGISLFHCFSCHKGGDVVEFTKAMTGCDNKSVRVWFAEHFGGSLNAIKTNGMEKRGIAPNGHKRQGIANQLVEESADMPEELKPLPFCLQLDNSVAYLKERGLCSETIHRYGLGLCSRGVLEGYIAIPIYTQTQSAKENPIAYLGRWPGEDFDEAAGRPRYLWPKGFTKNRVVYGLREALAGPKNVSLIVVEGPFKVYHLFQAGFTNTVAVFGSTLSDEQARILIETGRPIVLFFDGDEAGQAGMQLAAKKLIVSAFVRILILDDNKAPDDLSVKELNSILSFITVNVCETTNIFGNGV